MSLTRRTLAGLIALAPGQAWAQDGPLIAAASDLTGALPLIAERFRRAGGGPVRLTFGSSGALTRQIEAGAPFEVFLCAEASLADPLITSVSIDVIPPELQRGADCFRHLHDSIGQHQQTAEFQLWEQLGILQVLGTDHRTG